MSIATRIAREAMERGESISDAMRRYGLRIVSPIRSQIATEFDRLREEAKPKPSEARQKAMERQLQVNGPISWRGE